MDYTVYLFLKFTARLFNGNNSSTFKNVFVEILTKTQILEEKIMRPASTIISQLYNGICLSQIIKGSIKSFLIGADSSIYRRHPAHLRGNFKLFNDSELKEHANAGFDEVEL